MRKALMLLIASAPALAVANPLRYAEDRAPAIVNPAFATTMSEARIHELVFEGLFTDDHELRSTPRLAERWYVAEDGESMTIHLRRDVQWHDGEPFTAEDVVFTIEAMQHPKTASTEAGRVAWIDEVEAKGDHQLELAFEGAQAAPEDKLHFKILPAHRFSDAHINRTDPFRTNPIGTGPFRIDSFNPDNSISLVPFDAWHGTNEMSEMLMREVADQNYQAQLLSYNSLEALVRVLPRDLAALQSNRMIELYPYQTNSWWYIGFNHDDERLQEHRVRKAIHLLIDVDLLLEPVGTGDILTGPFVRSSPYYNHDVERRAHDPDRARQLLIEAGWTHDGRHWTKDGERLTLRLATPDNLETAQDVVINLQSQLRGHGVTVEPQFLGTAEWRQRIWRDRAYDLILSQWSFDRNEDIYEQFHSEGSRNLVGYANPEVDRLLDASREATDPQEKRALLQKVHAQVASDSPKVFLWTLDSYAALSINVQDVTIHPFYFFTWAHGWSMR